MRHHTPLSPALFGTAEANPASPDTLMDNFTPTVGTPYGAGAQRARAALPPAAGGPHKSPGNGGGYFRGISPPLVPPLPQGSEPSASASALPSQSTGGRDRSQNAAVSFRDVASPTEEPIGSPRPRAASVTGRGNDAFLGNTGKGYTATQDSRRRDSGSQSSSQGQWGDYGGERSSHPRLGPLQLGRLARCMYPPMTAGADTGDAYLTTPTPRVRDGVPSNTTSATDHASPHQEDRASEEGNPSQDPGTPPMVVATTTYYGRRGSTYEQQQALEKADEAAPPGFSRVPLQGGVQRHGLTNPFVCTSMLLFAPLVFLLVSSSILYDRAALQDSLRAAVDLSQTLDTAIMYLASEQGSAARMNILSNVKSMYVGAAEKTFYVTWDNALARYSRRHTDTNLCFSRASTLIADHEDSLQDVLGALTPWAFLDINYLSWTRLQCTTNTVNTDIMGFYDELIQQVLLFNGALSLPSSVRIGSDVEELRTLFSVTMNSIATASELFLQAKSDEIPIEQDAVALPSTKEETEFVVRALSAMRVVEMTLRFASDSSAAWEYVVEKTRGSGVADVSAIPSFKFVDAESAIHSIGFARDTEAQLMHMLQLTFAGQPYDSFNATLSDELMDKTRLLTDLGRAYFEDQVKVLQQVVSSSERARQVCLLVLIILSAVGLAYHLLRCVVALRSREKHEDMNQYTRQLRGSLLRMHEAALKLAHLRLEDTAAEEKLSRRPKLRTITAEERELYLSVSMLKQLEPYLPLPMRYPPREVPESALVNGSLFLKPALITRKGLVGIRMDFTATRRGTKGGKRRQVTAGAGDPFPSSRRHFHGLDLGTCTEEDVSQLASLGDNEGSSGSASFTHSLGTAGAGAGAGAGGGGGGGGDDGHESSKHFDMRGSFLRTTGGGGAAGAVGDGGFRLTSGKDGQEPSVHTPGGADVAHYAYRCDILRVMGLLANTRPNLHSRREDANTLQSGSGNAFLQSSGDVTMVWLNLCEDVKYANLLAVYICSALVRYCADNDKPCPELTVCCGDGVIGNISSYPTTHNDTESNGHHRHHGEAATAAPRAARPPYEDLWPRSAFFAKSDADPNALASAASVPVKTVADDQAVDSRGAPVMGTVVGGASGTRQPPATSTEMDLLVVATAGLSKRERAVWWVKQLLGMRVLADANAADIFEDGVYGKAAAGSGSARNGVAGSAAGRSQGGASGGDGSVFMGKVGGYGAGSFSTMRTRTSGGAEAEGVSEKVYLPAVLPPKFAPGPEAACLTSVIVYGEVLHDLEAVHALAEIHQQPVMASAAVMEAFAQERQAFKDRYDASHKRRRGAPGDPVGLLAEGEVSGVVGFVGKDRRCVVDVERFTAGLRRFDPTYVPVDLYEKQREYIPVAALPGDVGTAAAARKRKKKKNKSRDAESKSHRREGEWSEADSQAGGNAGELTEAQRQQRDTEQRLVQEEQKPMDLEGAFPLPSDVNETGVPVSYRRVIVSRGPAPIPGYKGPRFPQQRVDACGRPLFTASSELCAAYACVLPWPAAQNENVRGVLSSWRRAFNAYARLSYAAATIEPTRLPLRGDGEKAQLLAMAAEVKQAIADLRTDLLMHNELAQLALVGELSAGRLADVTATVEDCANQGPLCQPLEEHVSGISSRGDAAHPYPDTLQSQQAIDVVRFYSDANI